MTTKPPLQKILKGILHTEHENKHNRERMGIIKPQEKTRQIESSIVLVACTQILTQQKQLNGRNNHIPCNIKTKC
jgi:hypothetical protein